MRSENFRCSSATSTEESKNSFGTQSQNRTDQTIMSRTQNPNFMWWLDHNRPRWISQHFPKSCEVCRMNVIRWHVTPQPCSTNGQDSASIEPPPHFHCWFNPPNPVKIINLNQTARSTRCNFTYASSWKKHVPIFKKKMSRHNSKSFALLWKFENLLVGWPSWRRQLLFRVQLANRVRKTNWCTAYGVLLEHILRLRCKTSNLGSIWFCETSRLWCALGARCARGTTLGLCNIKTYVDAFRTNCTHGTTLLHNRTCAKIIVSTVFGRRTNGKKIRNGSVGNHQQLFSVCL